MKKISLKNLINSDTELMFVSLVGFGVLLLTLGMNEHILNNTYGIVFIFGIPLVFVWMTCGNFLLVTFTNKKDKFVKRKLDYVMFIINVIIDLALLALIPQVRKEVLFETILTTTMFILNPILLYGFKKLNLFLEKKNE